MNEIEKRFDAALDLVRWLDQRIAAQVEYQVEKRLAQEREYWRCHVVDLIAAERERLAALVEELGRKLTDWIKTDHQEVVDLVQRNQEQHGKTVAKMAEQSRKNVAQVNEAVERTFDRLEARFGRFVPRSDRSDDDGQPPPSTH
jgi:hypothetical protein